MLTALRTFSFYTLVMVRSDVLSPYCLRSLAYAIRAPLHDIWYTEFLESPDKHGLVLIRASTELRHVFCFCGWFLRPKAANRRPAAH